MKAIFLTCLILLSGTISAENFAFQGQHFVASYLDCNETALTNLNQLLAAMDLAVESSGATVLNQTQYTFEPDGLTAVYLLSESHASIHTYPEHNSCFVDLFTCGDHCSYEDFDAAMRAYLKPKSVNAKLLLRSDEIQEIRLP